MLYIAYVSLQIILERSTLLGRSKNLIFVYPWKKKHIMADHAMNFGFTDNFMCSSYYHILVTTCLRVT
jgi:hypothetical protein